MFPFAQATLHLSGTDERRDLLRKLSPPFLGVRWYVRGQWSSRTRFERDGRGPRRYLPLGRDRRCCRAYLLSQQSVVRTAACKGHARQDATSIAHHRAICVTSSRSVMSDWSRPQPGRQHRSAPLIQLQHHPSSPKHTTQTPSQAPHSTPPSHSLGPPARTPTHQPPSTPKIRECGQYRRSEADSKTPP